MFVEAIERIKPLIVQVGSVYNGIPCRNGCGTRISNKYVLTARHIIDPLCDTIYCSDLNNIFIQECEIFYENAQHDIIILKTGKILLDNSSHFIKIGWNCAEYNPTNFNISSPVLLENVSKVGTPVGLISIIDFKKRNLDPTLFSCGYISGLTMTQDKNNFGYLLSNNMIVERGVSGSCIFDSKANILGIINQGSPLRLNCIEGINLDYLPLSIIPNLPFIEINRLMNGEQ